MAGTKRRAPLDPNAIARGAIAASKRHLAQSAMLATVVAGLGAAMGALAIHLVGIGLIGAGLVAYSLLRIPAASRALQLERLRPPDLPAGQVAGSRPAERRVR